MHGNFGSMFSKYGKILPHRLIKNVNTLIIIQKYVMKNLFFIITLIVSNTSFSQRKSSSDVSVKGYYRDNGTYVAPHYRTSPNSTNRDNFSTIGNINPYTGESGTVKPDNNTSNGNRYVNGEATYNTYSMPSTIIRELDISGDNESNNKFWKEYYKDERKRLLDDRNKLMNFCKTHYHLKGKHFEKINGQMLFVNNKKNFKCDFCSQTNENYLYNVKKWKDSKIDKIYPITSEKSSKELDYLDLLKEINNSPKISFNDLSITTEINNKYFTVVNNRAYFYKSPNLENRSRAYLVNGELSKVYSSSGDFVYTEFQNALGKITKGWIRISDITIP